MSRAIRLMDACYEMCSDGYTVDEPIVHLFGRDTYRNRRHVEVDGFRPYFLSTLQEALDHSEDLSNDHRVRRVDTTDDEGNPIESLNGVRLAKIYTVAPYHVSDLRENFDETWEADILFPDRFCYDVGEGDGLIDAFEVEGGVTDGETVSVERIQSVDDVDVPPRVCYLDIEVAQSDDGPSVISKRGKELADNPITAITTYDNYLDECRAFILEHDQWSTDEGIAVVESYEGDESTSVDLFSSEHALLSSFANYMDETKFDVATAWNASFDFPYLVNRYLTLDHAAVYKLSDIRNVDDDGLDGEGRFMNSDVDGLVLFDLLMGYEKASIHELADSSLETVAREVTDVGKLDIADEVDYSEDDPYPSDIDKAWEVDPQTFVEYSIRDVEATVAIDNARGILT